MPISVVPFHRKERSLLVVFWCCSDVERRCVMLNTLLAFADDALLICEGARSSWSFDTWAAAVGAASAPLLRIPWLLHPLMMISVGAGSLLPEMWRTRCL
ncbi:hypothetical protein Nepgr_033756 [Nepenthes gracilis]|uniref:Uncharacterized protein n=1 Tax=Nepenthes gracilis TaxID=150966 RepID=A0AAD3TM09_NEPGR|nr:hypothetical protein Nepgr_033756 [Nepenthes gracilis]